MDPRGAQVFLSNEFGEVSYAISLDLRDRGVAHDLANVYAQVKSSAVLRLLGFQEM